MIEKEASVVPKLLQQIEANTGQVALESLWALNLSGGFSDAVAINLLKHEDQYVRGWTVRLLCDHYQVAPEIAAALQNLQKTNRTFTFANS